MKGKANMDNVDESTGSYQVVPPDWYAVDIIDVSDKETKNGDYMASIKLNIVDGDYAECLLWDNIIISDNINSPGYKILGRAKHFLHVIGEPYQGDIEYDTANWLFKRFAVRVYNEAYKGKNQAKVADHCSLDEMPKAGDPEVTQSASEPDVAEEEIPF